VAAFAGAQLAFGGQPAIAFGQDRSYSGPIAFAGRSAHQGPAGRSGSGNQHNNDDNGQNYLCG